MVLAETVNLDVADDDHVVRRLLEDRLVDELLYIAAITGRQVFQRGGHARGRTHQPFAVGIIPKLYEQLANELLHLIDIHWHLARQHNGISRRNHPNVACKALGLFYLSARRMPIYRITALMHAIALSAVCTLIILPLTRPASEFQQTRSPTLNRSTTASAPVSGLPRARQAPRYRVSYTAGQPYVGSTVSMHSPPGDSNLGNFIAWDAGAGKIVWSDPERFSVWSGALVTAGDVVFYGTLEGYLKAVDMKTGKELYRFKTPSGIIGNVITYEYHGKQYVAVLSGVGGWAGIGLAAGLTKPTEGLGTVGAYQKSVELYPARGHSHGVRTTLTGPSRFWFAASRDARGKRVPHLTILARVEHRLFGSTKRSATGAASVSAMRRSIDGSPSTGHGDRQAPRRGQPATTEEKARWAR